MTKKSEPESITAKNPQNCLNAIFWDYPEFTDKNYLHTILSDKKGNLQFYHWLMSRFLNYGRVIDTIEYFSLKEISDCLSELKLTAYSLKKWNRILEVYGTNSRK